ncbi:MAG TPA: ribbon-helix-helix domain-containing protein [Candidatus Nanoarchaeia archaeon]|nr:ribbon-helix-helix domain-containing protein [Candidatus Nanoarchaeia archaeon]
MRKNYVNVSVPSELVYEVDKVWKKSKKGYRSRAEFVLEAIREKLTKES